MNGRASEASAPRGEGQVRWRQAALVLSSALAIAYFALFLLVREAEEGAPENTFGAYLFLFITYLVGTVLLARLDRAAVYVLGAVVQIVLIVLFVVFGVGLLGPGVFEYDLVADLNMPVWAVAIVGAQVVLLVLLARLGRLTLKAQSPVV
jgi:hypothetical protein